MNDRERQADDLAFRQLETLLDARSKLLAAAEQMARDAYAEMKRVAETLYPERVDDLRCESADGIETLGVHDLAELVIDAVGRRLRRLEAAAVGGKAADLEEEVERLRAEVARLRGERQILPAGRIPSPTPPPPATPKINRRGGKPPWRALKAEPAPSRPAVSFDAWPEWARGWKDESTNWERDRDVVLAAGAGLALMQDVREQLAEWWSVKPRSGSIRRAMGRVEKVGFIEIIRPRSDYPEWRPVLLFRLTQRGQDVYRLLRGDEPGVSQTAELLTRYESAERAVLVVEAAEMLWLAGYEVTLFPDAVRLDDGNYAPDLVAERAGERLYVECEWVVGPGQARKWELVHAASGGRFCVVTPTANATDTIRREILEWAGDRPLTLWMADLERSRAGGGVWVAKLPG